MTHKQTNEHGRRKSHKQTNIHTKGEKSSNKQKRLFEHKQTKNSLPMPGWTRAAAAAGPRRGHRRAQARPL